MKAKRSLGQHFLNSEKYLSAIVDAGNIHADDLILEIGPGTGLLTEKLLKLAGRVIAVEKDKELVILLKEKFKEEIALGKLDLIEKDILDFDLTKQFHLIPNYDLANRSLLVCPGEQKRSSGSGKIIYKIIANIPYYITGAILKKFLQSDFQPEQMILLVQKEVAQRIVARDKKESLLSISVKVYGQPKLIKTVPAGAFSPAPKVDSAILAISDISKRDLNEKNFFKVLKAGFAHKRKLLINNLSGLFNKELIKKAFAECKIDEKTRPETLNLNNWLCLTNELSRN